VSRRARWLAFGACGALVVLGVVCALLVGGLTGQVLVIGLGMAGVGGALLLIFFEVGLSEDRERERESERRLRRAAAGTGQRRYRPPRRPRRPG
jgi:hypothetical protein